MTLRQLIAQANFAANQHPEILDKEIEIIDNDGWEDDHLLVVKSEVVYADQEKGNTFVITYEV